MQRGRCLGASSPFPIPSVLRQRAEINCAAVQRPLWHPRREIGPWPGSSDTGALLHIWRSEGNIREHFHLKLGSISRADRIAPITRLGQRDMDRANSSAELEFLDCQDGGPSDERSLERDLKRDRLRRAYSPLPLSSFWSSICSGVFSGEMRRGCSESTLAV